MNEVSQDRRTDSDVAKSRHKRSTNQRQAKPRRTFKQEIRRRIIALCIAIVAYVLSVGPMYWSYYDAKYNTGSLVLAMVYEPLFRLCEFIPFLGRMIDAYIMLWIG